MSDFTCPFCGNVIVYVQSTSLSHLSRDEGVIITPIRSEIAVMCPCGACGVVEVEH
jgi:predicted RNA-binding Zn-ribbon protein involved in translation (DUF1610 family)